MAQCQWMAMTSILRLIPPISSPPVSLLGHLLLFPPRAEPLLHAVVATVVISYPFLIQRHRFSKYPPIDHASCFMFRNFFLLST
ncbi:hypothetical protein BC826DRAFT_1005125 [Russula brevipes]|nr:hypothetical protein BC826DRAFT_1005125 [Russula brevipes]